MRHEEKEKQVTLPSSFVSIVHRLPDIYEITEKRDVISFMTKDIEKVWQSLENSGCGISDIEIQNKTLLVAYLIQQGRTRHESITKN